MKFPQMNAQERAMHSSAPVDPWDEVDYAALQARNSFHTVHQALTDKGDIVDAHKLAVQYGQLMATVWLCEILEPMRAHFVHVLDKLGILQETDNGDGAPPAGGK